MPRPRSRRPSSPQSPAARPEQHRDAAPWLFAIGSSMPSPFTSPIATPSGPRSWRSPPSAQSSLSAPASTDTVLALSCLRSGAPSRSHRRSLPPARGRRRPSLTGPTSQQHGHGWRRLATARSGSPSPFRSPSPRKGRRPGNGGGAGQPPFPSFSSTDAVPAVRLATTTSGLPSPSRSPSAIPRDRRLQNRWARQPPPVPSKTDAGAAGVGNHQVRTPVAVHVADSDGCRLSRCRTPFHRQAPQIHRRADREHAGQRYPPLMRCQTDSAARRARDVERCSRWTRGSQRESHGRRGSGARGERRHWSLH
jgi:hypothetical protein